MLVTNYLRSLSILESGTLRSNLLILVYHLIIEFKMHLIMNIDIFNLTLRLYKEGILLLKTATHIA